VTTVVTRSGFRLASPVTALALGGLLLVMLGLGLFLGALTRQLAASSSGLIATVVAFGAVGVVVAYHQPRNPMGWVMIGAAGSLTLDALSGAYEKFDYGMHHGALPLGRVAEFLHPAWAPAALLAGLAVLLFPDGKLPSPRWRPVVWTYLAVGAVWLAGAYFLTARAIITHHAHLQSNGDLSVVANPTGSAAWWGVVQGVFFPLLAVAWLAWLAGQVVSYRRSTGERREQLKWLLGGAAVCVLGAITGVTLGNSQSPVLRAVGAVGIAALLALPVSIGIGILKFRLYEIDRIISRTLAYAAVTALLVGFYAGIVLLTTRVLSFSSPVAVAASTLAAAALFSPLRRWVQRMVDRRFNRARYNADRTIAAFAARLQDAVDTDAVRGDLTAVVHRSLEPAHVSLWLTRGQP
jgi:hypothetical protein